MSWEFMLCHVSTYMTSPGRFWEVLGGPGRTREVLEVMGGHLSISKDLGDHGSFLGDKGRTGDLLVLGVMESLEVQGGPGRFLGIPVRTWEVLGGSGKSWEVLGGHVSI